MTPWRRFIGLLQLDKRDIRQIIYYAIFAGLVALTLPLGIQAIVNLIQGAQVTTSWIVLVVLVTLGVGFQGILQLMQFRILENVQQKIFTRSSFEFAYRLPKIRMSELRNNYPPELVNRFFDTLTVQKGLSKIVLDFPAAILQIFFGLILLSFYHPFFILYGFLLVTLIYFAFRYTARKGLETSLRESKSKYKVAHWLQEIARSLISFKISGRTKLSMERNNQLTQSYLEARESHFKVLMFQFLQMIAFKVLITAGLLIVGGFLVLNQQMNIGQFVAAEIIILLIIASIEKLITGLESFYDVLTSLEKIGQVVDKELEEQEGTEPFQHKDTAHIVIDDVGYTTPEGQQILNGISLQLEPKDRVLLEGKSGSGKSTLLKLLSGLIQPTSGDIYVNDFSLKGMHINVYRSHIGQVLPEQMPFEGTLLENITFGNPEISVDAVNRVIEQIGLQDFVRKQSKGIHSGVFSEGKQIPHSVSKRILLARAIVHNPKILILKDALEHFDKKEAAKIIEYLGHPDRPWLLITSSSDHDWNKIATKRIHLEQGEISKVKSNYA
ncbi:ATP-binding cassette domain-containing protein [Altibacter sp.]|nr:ATP-binding cassette domain-containing protein [Altibacter sp.]